MFGSRVYARGRSKGEEERIRKVMLMAVTINERDGDDGGKKHGYLSVCKKVFPRLINATKKEERERYITNEDKERDVGGCDG